MYRPDGYTTIKIEVGPDTAQCLSEAANAAARDQGIDEADPRFTAYVAGHRSGLLETAYLAIGGSAWDCDVSSLADRKSTVALTVSLPTNVADHLKATARSIADGDDQIATAVEAALIESAFTDCWMRWQQVGRQRQAA